MLRDLLLTAAAALGPFVLRSGRAGLGPLTIDVLPAAIVDDDPPPEASLPPSAPDGPKPPEAAFAPLSRTPGAPGTTWLDQRGRVRKMWRCSGRAARAVNPHEAVMRFTAWMRDEGFTGWHPAEDIVEFYSWFCDEQGLEEMNHDLLRERLASAPGVTRERRRLNGTTDREMIRIKRRLGGADRAVLYRIASIEEMAEEARTKPKARKSQRAKPARSKPTVIEMRRVA